MQINREIPNVILTRTLINNTPTAYIILDEQFNIHFMNSYFMKIRGFELDQVLGEKCYVLSNSGAPCKQCAVKKALSTNEKQLITRKDILSNGTVRYLDDYAIPLNIDLKDGHRYLLEIMVDRSDEMRLRDDRNKKFNEILTIMTSLLEEKDLYTAQHSYNVKRLATKLAYKAGLSAKEIWNIGAAASLHDIGKLQIPDCIINKPGKLTDKEYELIKKHPVYSHELLAALPTFSKIKDIVLFHHERYDGKGYPNGLRGEEIPLGARIIAIADTYDAITSTRSYRNLQSHETALTEISNFSGTQFDSELAELFINLDFKTDTDMRYNPNQDKDNRITRLLTPPDYESGTMYDKHDEIHQIMNEEQLLECILKHTPYGYVLINKDYSIEYMCDKLLDYLELTEEDLSAKKCNALCNLPSSDCAACAIKQTFNTGKVNCVRREKFIKNKNKIFDLFAMPIKASNGETAHVIVIIIDRTKEIEPEKAFEADFIALMTSLDALLKKYEEADDYEHMSYKIETIKKKAIEQFIHSN